MNAVIVREKAMSEADRIAKLEAGVQHLQSDITDIKGTLEWLRRAFETFKIEVAQEFGAIRAEFARELGSFKSEVSKESGSFRSEVARQFGSVRTSIERAKLWMVVTGLGTILSVWGAALALARFLKP